MICFRDMTFCGAPCANDRCRRALTAQVQRDAERWWRGPDAPIAVADFSPNCPDFQPTTEEAALASASPDTTTKPGAAG